MSAPARESGVRSNSESAGARETVPRATRVSGVAAGPAFGRTRIVSSDR